MHQEEQKTKKDIYDKLHAISGFVSGVLIALMGLVFTYIYNERQSQRDINLKSQQITISRVQTARDFIPHLVKDGPEREIALVLMSDLGIEQKRIAALLVEKINRTKTTSAGDIIMASISVADLEELAKQTVTSKVLVSAKLVTREGWAYLGEFLSQKGKWQTRYFDIDSTIIPDSLNEKILVVRKQTGSLNVRENMPTPTGTFPKVIDVLEIGSEVKIEEIKPWSSTGYMWARISYAPEIINVKQKSDTDSDGIE